MRISFPGMIESVERGRKQARPHRPATILYRALLLALSLAVLTFTPAASQAQVEEGPQLPLRKKPAKDMGPRALALLKLAPDGKVTLAPIAIMLGDKFYDATVYKATPVPMALEYGTVYEAERAGSSVGLFTVRTALRSNAINAPTPWVATGTWLPAGSETAKTTTRRAETVPVGIETKDQRPRLTRPGMKPSTPSPTAPAGGETPSADSKPAAKPDDTKSEPESEPDDGRPHLKRKQTEDEKPADSPSVGTSPAPPAASTPPGSVPSDKPKTNDQTAGGANGTGPSAGANQKPAGQASNPPPPATTPPAQAPASQTDEGSHPRLRRGRPTEPLPSDEDVPGYSRPNAKGGSTANAGKTDAKAGEVAATQGRVQVIPAISDAAGPDPHSFGFIWVKGDEEERRKQMIDLAKQKLRAYIDAQAKRTITAKPAAQKGGVRKPVAKAAEPVFGNVDMTTYDLWGSNQLVIVLSAEAHVEPAAGAVGATSAANTRYSILLVARTDIYNNLHPLYVGVTDQFHLDLTPRLELIDAVDADGDGRGELLFREISDAGTGYVIYRATADTLWKMFDSLHPE